MQENAILIIFTFFALIAFSAYLRISMIVRAIDAGLENPPQRKHLQDKLRVYKEYCRDREKFPILLIAFGIGVFGAFICWLPMPWLIYR